MGKIIYNLIEYKIMEIYYFLFYTKLYTNYNKYIIYRYIPF